MEIGTLRIVVFMGHWLGKGISAAAAIGIIVWDDRDEIWYCAVPWTKSLRTNALGQV